ncbi:MAG: hypothetical protein ACK5YR_17375 [Pirellula sp.]
MVNSFGDNLRAMHESWRKPMGFTRRQFALGVTGFITVFLVFLFIGLVYQSVAKPLVSVLVVGPTIKAGSIHADEDCWIDLPQVFSSASAACTAQDLVSYSNSIYEHVVSPAQVVKEIESREFRGSPLMVYYSGVLSVASPQVAVVESSKQAGTSTQAAELCELIRAIKNCDASIGVVVLDLTMPDLPGPLSFAASHCYEQARLQIDTALRGEGNVPVSIQMNMNRIPRWHELGIPSELGWEKSILPNRSECSSRFINAIDAFSTQGRVEVHALQEQLGKRSFNDQKPVIYQAQTEWLGSPSWPINDRFISFSPWKKNGVTEQKSPSASDEIAADLEPKVLVRKSLENYQNLLLLNHKKNEIAILPWLSIPASETYSSIHPAAYSLLEKNYFMLRTAHELAPDALDQQGVMSIVETLQDAFNAKPLTDRVPSWLTSYFQENLDSTCSQVNSIIAKAVLSSYGFTASLEKAETDWLATLQALLESTDPVNESRIIESLKKTTDQQSVCLEYRWINAVLGEENLEPTIWKELIHTKLLGLRMMSDPLLVSQFKSKLSDAGQQMVAAERLLFDKSPPDWKSRGVQSIKNVKEKLNAIYADFSESRSQQRRSITWFYNEMVRLDHFSFPAPELEPDGGVARDEEVLARFKSLWSNLYLKSIETRSKQSLDVTEKTDWLSEDFSRMGAATKFEFVSNAKRIFELMGDDLKSVHSTDTTGHASIENSIRPLSLLFARQEVLNESNLQSFDPKQMITELALFNQQLITDAAQGAQTWEADLLTSSSRSWQKISTRLRPEQSDGGVAESFNNSIRIDAPLKLDFSTQDQIEGVIGLQLESNDNTVATITSEYNDTHLQLQLGGKILASGASLPFDIYGGKTRPSNLPISVRKMTAAGQNSPVILYVSHGGQKRRAVLESKLPLPQMISFALQNQTLLTSKASAELYVDGGTKLEPALAGNKHNQMLISAKNLDFRDALISHRIMLNQTDKAFPVHGVLDQSKAKQILSSFGAMPVAASTIPRLYIPGQTEPVAFLPDASFAKVTDTSFRELVIESDNQTSGQVQYTIIKAKAINPRQFIHAAVTYHSESQMMEIVFSPTKQDGFPVAGVIAQCELWDLATGRLLATPQCVLDPNTSQKSIRMSVAGSQAKSVLVNVAIDNWKSVFVFEIDRDRSGVYEPNTSFVGAAIRAAGDSNVVKTDLSTIQVEMDLCINEPSFEMNRDWIHIGIDQNLDRTLDGEPVAEVRDTKTHQTVFHGVGAQGEMILESKIESIKSSLPIEHEWNRKGAVLAKIVRAGETIYSNGPELIFDKRKPEIRSINLQGASPIILGKPLVIEIVTDDADLSGVELVEGGWSVTGEAEFHDRMTIVPALSNQSNRWIVTLPTATILPGYNTVLIRARDRAGNMSKTYALPVPVITDAEYQKQVNAAATIIRGRLIADYKIMPGAKLKLGIEAEPNNEKRSEVPVSNAELKVIATAMADENGAFLFSAIPSGKYILESNVILRGTRIVQRTPIVVDALAGPADCSITVGRQK